MFAYCGNNPVCCSDPTGHIALVDDLPALLGLATAVVGRYNINDFFRLFLKEKVCYSEKGRENNYAESDLFFYQNRMEN